MDAKQVDLVRSMVSLLEGRESIVAQEFYEQMFAIDPAIRALFPDDLTMQQQKLMDELTWMVSSLEQMDEFVARAADLGHRHVQYGVDVHHYDAMKTALAGALAKTLGDEFTDEMAAAWRRACNLITETMLMGARW